MEAKLNKPNGFVIALFPTAFCSHKPIIKSL